MVSDRQQAARMRTSRIRSLRGIRIHLIEDPVDQELFERIIDRQLRSMGAETQKERRQRWQEENDQIVAGKAFNLKIYEETGKPYVLTDEDVERYLRLGW